MILASSMALAAVVALPTHAQQDRSVMIRSLRSASDFRVRVQVAFAMGNTQDAALRPHLERALRGDANPAVRAAAATGLGRLGARRALPALRRARHDSSASVRMQVQRSIERLTTPPRPTPIRTAATEMGVYPAVTVVPPASQVAWRRVRYVVVLGRMANRSRFPSGDALAAQMRDEVQRNLGQVRGVAVFRETSALDPRAHRQIQRRRLPTLTLDGTLRSVDARRASSALSVRCEVSLMLSEAGSLRGTLSGAATGSGQRSRRRDLAQRLARQALSAAVRSAMSGAPTALQRAAQR